jgi:hypothetical protein
VINESNFALTELIKLSDSTIYSTLKISKILSAHKEDGLFHDNTILELEFYSPYFKSGVTLEKFEIFVMTHKEDAVKSFAINEFPEMHEYAIEHFTNIKVEMMKKKSEEAFRWLELEAIYTSLGEDFQINQSIQAILDDLNSEYIMDMRSQNSLKFQKQLYGEFLQQEIDLHEVSLGGLFNITVGKGIQMYM